jgi:hypothetical protein
MEDGMLVVNVIKYIFVAGVVVEVALIVRALVGLARAKAGAASAAAPGE